MDSKDNYSLNNQVDSSQIEDEIDLKKIFNKLLINKKIVIYCTLSGIFISTLIALTSKKTWQGEFQIVIEDNSSEVSPLGSVNPNLLKFTGLAGDKNPLRTEVEILKSPSVLMSIFDFVKKEKDLMNKNDMRKLRFNDWRKKHLNIELESGTSILNFAYRDTEKDLILPVLNKISRRYQAYSGKKRLRGIELGINYFEEQLPIYNKKSLESLRAAQQYGIDNELTVLKGDANIDLEIVNSLNLENIRIEAANEIRSIKEKLEKLETLEEDSDQIIYISSRMPLMSAETKRIKDMDASLASKRVTFNDADDSIQKSLQERKFLISLLKRQVKGFLLAQKEDAELRFKASERPEGVLIKYRQLLNQAAKDKRTLDSLENQYRSILLEKARIEDPWELITKPTLLPFPVAPERRKIVTLGFLSGAILGTLGAFIYDKKKKIPT